LAGFHPTRRITFLVSPFVAVQKVANASGMTSNADSNAKMFGEDTNRQRGH
jgi:hypothetical protein